MVQGELSNGTPTTAVTPQQAQQNGTATAKLYENLNNLNNNGGGDANGEKKKKVGNYIISKTIGEGSFAKVRLGYHLITQQMVCEIYVTLEIY